MKADVQTMLAAALDYAAQGKPVFPCNPVDKRPLTKHGFKDATTDEEQIKAWWQRRPEAMIGMPMGPESDVFCVDLDRKPGGSDGVATWQELQSRNGVANTKTHETPSTGRHLLFKYQDGIHNIPLDRLAPGLEVKGEGGYIIAPPSRMADGKEYRVIYDCEPATAPPWLLAMFQRRKDEFEEQLDRDAAEAAAELGAEPPEFETAFEKVKAALEVIPSDDYDPWYKIAGAIRRELGDAGFKLYEAWSKKSKKYNAKECRKKWDDAKNISQINAGTIFYLADEADETWRDRYEQRQAGSTGSAQSTTGSRSQKLADLLKNAATLQTQTFEPLRWTVPKYLLEGLNLLGGRPKIGKSWWALDVAAAVASDNGTCMGEECEHGDVLALMLEDTERRMQRRLTKMLGAKWPERLTYATSWPRSDEGGVDLIREWISTAAKPRLIIIDILERVLPRLSNKDRRSQYSTDYYGVATLQHLAKKYPGLCFLVTTHQRKADAEDFIDTISGTLGVTGAVDAILILGKDKVSGNKFLYGRGRDLEEFNVIVKQDEHARWLVLGPATEQTSSPERNKILAALQRAGKPMTIREIADDIGSKYNNVKYLLFKLYEEGQVEKVGSGLYRLPIPQEEMPF